VTDPDGGTVEAVQLGHAHSVSGKLLKRARELHRWANSARRWDADERADAVVDAARGVAERLIAEAANEAERQRARADREIEQLYERARQETAETMRSTGDRVDRLVNAAEEQLAVARAKAEETLKDVERQRSVLLKKAEERWAEVAEGAYSVEEVNSLVGKAERRLEDLARTHKTFLAQIQKDAAEADRRIEEDFYRVFKQSIDGQGRFPTLDEFSGRVKLTQGVTLQLNEAGRLHRRFTHRFNAELQEDHIA
jgi:hypothetical protein